MHSCCCRGIVAQLLLQRDGEMGTPCLFRCGDGLSLGPAPMQRQRRALPGVGARPITQLLQATLAAAVCQAAHPLLLHPCPLAVLPAVLPLLRCASFCAAATPLQGNGDLLFNGVHQQAQEKGYAFVEFRSVEEASNAMALDGVKFRDAYLKVSLGWGGCGAGSGSAALEQQTAGLELWPSCVAGLCRVG